MSFVVYSSKPKLSRSFTSFKSSYIGRVHFAKNSYPPVPDSLFLLFVELLKRKALTDIIRKTPDATVAVTDKDLPTLRAAFLRAILLRVFFLFKANIESPFR